MARIPRSLVGDMIYHILNRANNRDVIFQEEKDYSIFEKIIFEGKEKFPINIFSFCIMPNHWHFVLSGEVGDNISNFMRWITHTHTQRWHTKYKSVGYGHVYQGRYKSFPIEKDDHFIQVCRYVERNPLRAGLVEKAEDWKWSSLWIKKCGTEKQKTLLSSWPVDEPDSYLEWVNSIPNDEKEKLTKIRYAIKRGCPFGKESWTKKMAINFGLGSTLNSIGRPKKGT
jgi:putative transposase